MSPVSKNSLNILKRKKNLRIIDISEYKSKNITSIKNFEGAFLVQNKDKIILDKKNALKLPLICRLPQ